MVAARYERGLVYQAIGEEKKARAEFAAVLYNAGREKAVALSERIAGLPELAAPKSANDNRLLRWVGAFESSVPDAAQRHDDYLGQALYEELKGGQGP